MPKDPFSMLSSFIELPRYRLRSAVGLLNVSGKTKNIFRKVGKIGQECDH